MRGILSPAAVALTLILGGCATEAPSSVAPAAVDPSEGAVQRIRIVGSDTMLHLNRRLATTFMEEFEGVAVLADGGGTGVGVEALIAGDADLCAASRPLTAGEVQRLHSARRVLGVRHLVAMDAIVIMVHPSAAIEDLTAEQAADVFRGHVRSWSELGGAELAVVPVRRSAASGTHRLMRDMLLSGDPFTGDAVVVNTATEMLTMVETTPGAIGYGRFDPGARVRPLRVDGVSPDPESVTSGAYPLGRYLYFYTAAPAEGASRVFLEWVLGPIGQEVVETTGFIPLWIRRGASDPA